MTARLALVLTLAAAPLAAQDGSAPATVTRAPGPQYQAGGLKTFLLGENWRELWARPLTLPVLDVDTFEGGLEMERQGGGNQSITLHMVDASGKGWVFRSLDKYPDRGLPGDLRGAPAGDIVADQTSSLHPGGHLVVPRLVGALGLLHVRPRPYVMGDSPRLGEFRETFAGMIGMLEEKPNEGPDDTPGFGGSRKIKDSDKLLEDLEESPEYRLDDREYIRARLLDFIVNDTDRGTDQWRWARFGEEGAYVYRPIPRDRDWTFVNGRGVVAKLVQGAFPKLAGFDATFPSLDAFMFSSHLLDRRLLTRMTRDMLREEVAFVQQALSDDVIAAAVGDLPPAQQPGHADALTAALRARRDAVGSLAAEWYAWLSKEPDLRATDEDDIVHLEHQPDGTLRVRMATQEDADVAYYDRTFAPGETHEVRVFLHGGADHAIVSGSPARIRTLVVGGGGDDTLEDATGRARFYDDRGDNEFRAGGGTQVSTKPWEAPEIPEGVRLGRDWAPDYGTQRGFGPVFGYEEGAGLVLGVGHSYTNYGFRRLPYALRANLSGLYATRSGGWGGALHVDYRGENTRRGLQLDARATQFDSFRFYGFGNDSPRLSRDASLVMMDRVRVYPAVVWHLGPRPGAASDDDESEDETEAEQQPDEADDQPDEAEEAPDEAEEQPDGAEEEEADAPQRPFAAPTRRLTGRITIGPVMQWTDARVPSGNPLAGTPGDGFGQVGAQLGFEIENTDRSAAPRRGYTATLSAAGYPAVWDVTEPFGTLAATATAYLPLIGQTHLALRAGGGHVIGDAFPVWDAAFIGGRTTLRGFDYQRFAGESAAFGSAELRVPIDTVQVFFNGELGVFGLVDAGRVWHGDDSGDEWHTSEGVGLWFATMGRSISLTYARGERDRWYLWLGLPF